MASLEWRKDGYGRPDAALYFGEIYVGEIMRVVPDYDWRNASISDAVKKHHEKLEPSPWRGWLMTTDEGDAIGYYPTPDDARAAVEAKFKELTK